MKPEDIRAGKRYYYSNIDSASVASVKAVTISGKETVVLATLDKSNEVRILKPKKFLCPVEDHEK